MTSDDRGGLWGVMWSVLPVLMSWGVGGLHIPQLADPTSRGGKEVVFIAATVIIVLGSLAAGVYWERRHRDRPAGEAGSAGFLLRFAAAQALAALALACGMFASIIAMAVVFGFNSHTQPEQVMGVLPVSLAYAALLYVALDACGPVPGGKPR